MLVLRDVSDTKRASERRFRALFDHAFELIGLLDDQGTLLAANLRGHPSSAGIILLVVSFLGLSTSYGISRVPVCAPQRMFQWNFVAEVWKKRELR